MGSAASSRASMAPRQPGAEERAVQEAYQRGPSGAVRDAFQQARRGMERRAAKGRPQNLRSAADLQELEREIALRDLELEALRVRKQLSAAAVGEASAEAPPAPEKPRRFRYSFKGPVPPRREAAPPRPPPPPPPPVEEGPESPRSSTAGGSDDEGALADAEAGGGAASLALPFSPRPAAAAAPRRRSMPTNPTTSNPRLAMRWRSQSGPCLLPGLRPPLVVGEKAPPPSPVAPGRAAPPASPLSYLADVDVDSRASSPALVQPDPPRTAVCATPGGPGAGFRLLRRQSDAAILCRSGDSSEMLAGPAAPRRASLPAALGALSAPASHQASAFTWGPAAAARSPLAPRPPRLLPGALPSLTELLTTAAARADARRSEARAPAWVATHAALEGADGLAASLGPLYTPAPRPAAGFGALGSALRLNPRPVARLR